MPKSKNPSPSKSTDLTLKQLFAAAKRAMGNAHAPYSGFHVGAAVIADNGKIYGGCNVENASYGGTNCAERTAIFSAVADGAKSVQAILVMTDAPSPWPPCGFCRQVMSEFMDDSAPVYVANKSAIKKTYRLKELLPMSFSAKHLK